MSCGSSAMPSIAEVRTTFDWFDPSVPPRTDLESSDFDPLYESGRTLARFAKAVIDAPGVPAYDIRCIQWLIRNAGRESMAHVKVSFLEDIIAEVLSLRAGKQPTETITISAEATAQLPVGCVQVEFGPQQQFVVTGMQEPE